MRALTAKEKRLLLVLLGAIFVLINVIGLNTYLARLHSLKSSLLKLQGQLVENRAILEVGGEWLERAAWLDANQPTDDVATTDDDAKFYEFVETSAKNFGLSYQRREAGAVPQDGLLAEVFDSSQVKGTMEALIKWLVQLQDPSAFRAIKQLSIRSGEPPQVIAEVTVSRWYRPSSGGETP
jgi:hypothetical protein